MTASSTVASLSKSGVWGRYRITILFALVTVPLSGVSVPMSIFSRVVFPVPLMPMIPTFSISSIVKEASSKSGVSV